MSESLLMYKKIGVAGYMGSGKSTCARLLAESSSSLVIDADAVAKELMTEDKGLQARLVAAFGGSIGEGGGISSEALGRIVFAAKDELVKLNEIVHPSLVRRLDVLVHRNGRAHCILDAALIPLWGIERWFDVCLWVDASAACRLQRLKGRWRDIDKESLCARMRLQEEVMPAPDRSPWIRLENEGCVEELAAAVAPYFPGARDARVVS
jgi:dephospho-CoA kinase